MLQPGEGPTHYCYGAPAPGVPVWNPRCLPLFLVRNPFSFGVTVSEAPPPPPPFCMCWCLIMLPKSAFVGCLLCPFCLQWSSGAEMGTLGAVATIRKKVYGAETF